MQSAQGAAAQGGQLVTTSGLASTTKVEASYPLCTVTIYIHGGGLATIYSDNASTPLANPFTATSTGYWDFYAANGHYDVVLSDNVGSGPAAPVTFSDILLDDPAAVAVTSVFTRIGAVVAQTGDYTVAQVTGAAPLASPTFTGAPAAPTAAPGTNTTQLATTAFVTAAIPSAGVSSVFSRTGAVTAQSGDYTVGQVTGAAPAASPTLTCTPVAPPAAPGTNTTQLATTAFVHAAVAAATSPVASVFGRTGAVVQVSGDYSVGQVTGAAPLASPVFTGDPQAPTPPTCDNDTSIATTAFVKAQGYLTGSALTSATLVTPQIGNLGTTLNAIITKLSAAPNSAYTSISAQTGQEQTFTVTGAAVTGIAMASPVTDLGNTGLTWSARVSATDTVTVRIVNATSGALTPSAVNWNIVVIQ